MRKGELTGAEKRLLQELLAAKGIVRYAIVGAVGEGKMLPGSLAAGDIEALSGIVVTPTDGYTFWLDWNAAQGRYTLGDEDGTWAKLGPEQLARAEIVEAQRTLAHQE